MMKSKLAVAILNWNGKNWLEKFLPSVVRFSDGADIYVIDNASTDDSVKFLQLNFPSVKIVINSKNSGFAGGYNEGLRQIDAEYYCLLNSDVEVTENWIEPVLNLFEKNSDIAAIQPKILSYNDKNKFEFAGAAGGLIDNLGYPYCRGRVFDEVEEDKGQYNDETEIFWASGCALFIRSKDFWNQNGFDERFFAHQEEIDLCWRAFNQNLKVKYCGKSTVYHVGGATLKDSNPHKTFLNFRNSLWMMLKNLPKNKLFPVLFLRLAQDGLAGVKFMTEGKFSHLWAILKAHFYFYLKFFRFLNKRESKQYDNYYKIKSITYHYFVKKGKVFENKF